MVEEVDMPQWLVKGVRNLEGKKVVSVEGGVGTSREISWGKKLISDLMKGGRDMIYLPSPELQHTVERLLNRHASCLAQRNIDCLRISKVGYVIQKHGGGGSE